RRRRELGAHRDRGLAVEFLERHRSSELHGLDIVAAAVMIDKPLGLHDFVEGDAVLVIASVGAVHHETPGAARPKVIGAGGGAKPAPPPPLPRVGGVGPARPSGIGGPLKPGVSPPCPALLNQNGIFFWRPPLSPLFAIS